MDGGPIVGAFSIDYSTGWLSLNIPPGEIITGSSNSTQNLTVSIGVHDTAGHFAATPLTIHLHIVPDSMELNSPELNEVKFVFWIDLIYFN